MSTRDGAAPSPASGFREDVVGLFRGIRTASPRLRIAIAMAVALLGGAITYAQYRGDPGHHSDFGMLWFAGRALLDGSDPYALIGPGRTFDYRWPLIYPLPAVVSVLPLSFLSEGAATATFIAISSGLLALGVTRKSWHLMPLFVTDAFFASAKLGQWSILLTAALFFPRISAFAIAKPQTSIPILAGSASWRSMRWAVAGGGVLTAIAFLLQPSWLGSWLDGMRAARNMAPPLFRPFGFAILLVLLRWRRPESWMTVLLAALPQSWGWYGTLPLFTIPNTFGESVMLVAVATLVPFVTAVFLPSFDTASGFYSWVGGLIVLTTYVPVVFMILRRPNTARRMPVTSG